MAMGASVARLCARSADDRPVSRQPSRMATRLGAPPAPQEQLNHWSAAHSYNACLDRQVRRLRSRDDLVLTAARGGFESSAACPQVVEYGRAQQRARREEWPRARGR